MPLRPKINIPGMSNAERILSFGGAKMGKSHDFYSIASLAQQTGSDAKFFIADTDNSVGRTLSDPRFSNLLNEEGAPVNIIVKDTRGDTDAESWEIINTTLDLWRKIVRPQDWVMIDMISPTWDWCQAAFTAGVFGKDRTQYFIEARKAMGDKDKSLQAFEGWRDYTVINPMYSDFMTKLLTLKANLYATAEVKPISDQADKETKAQFGPHGVVPAGQKKVPHKFHTVLWKVQYKPLEFEAITTGDRGGREYMQGKRINNFAVDYLLNVAGWTTG